MKKKILLLAAVLTASLSFSGCVKIIDTGTEGDYTGVKEFDASADSSSAWGQITEEITGAAKDYVEAAKEGFSGSAAVSGTAKITEFESKGGGKKNALIIEADGFDGTVKIQIGSVYTGTDIRDIQTVTQFGDFTNQTEWSQYAKALNGEADSQVVAPLNLDESCVGKTVTFVGAASMSGDEMTITPVSMTVE